MAGEGFIVELLARERVAARRFIAIHGRAQIRPSRYRNALGKDKLAALSNPLRRARSIFSGMTQSAKCRLEVTEARMESLP